MKRVIEPLKTLSDYGDSVSVPREKKAVLYFMDGNFKPLSISRTAIASTKEPQSFKNHIEYLPRVGDSIMVNEKSMYRVKEVIHSLPSMRNDCQKIFIVLE